MTLLQISLLLDKNLGDGELTTVFTISRLEYFCPVVPFNLINLCGATIVVEVKPLF